MAATLHPLGSRLDISGPKEISLSGERAPGNDEQDLNADRLPQADDIETQFFANTARSNKSIAGTVIGPYQLRQVLGHGGMGEVWLADQKQPVQRRVAVKLIKAGMDTREVVARFESERQALALMNHPAIAKVFDGGSTPEGRPYFVMEYVIGAPITTYCDQHKLTTRQRLTLFVRVCEGVQHAHQKAILHRDLKPSNIIVGEIDGVPAPKIIDFGVAKATAQRLTADSMFTLVGAIIGTPGYMSPEQADSGGADVDTRTDVYSLGVVLYELLVGALPLDFSSTPLDQVPRKLREEDAPRPSTKLRTLAEHSPGQSKAAAQNRGADAPALAGQLRGDLDAIALKALEKDRARRYATPAELAADIGRYLRNEPVQARPASAWYRTRKYIRRHRVAAGVTATAAVLLVAFAVTQTIELRRVRLERDRADRVTEFMTGMFKVSDPSEARGNDIRAREILDKASQQIDTGLAKDPELQAQMMAVMGNVYMSLGLYSKSESLLGRAIAIRRRALGPDNPDTLKSMYELAIVLNEDSKYSEADKLARETIDVQRRVLGAQNHDTLASMSKLALFTQNEGHYAEAEQLDRNVLDTTKRVFGQQDQLYINTLQDSAIVSAYQGKYSDAEKAFREILEIDRRELDPDNPKVSDDTGNLASTLLYEERYDEAEKLYRGILPRLRRLRGPDHPRTLLVAGNLALTLKDEKHYPEAEQLFRETLDIKRKKLGPEHRSTLVTMGNLADTLTAQGKYPEAEQLVRQTLQTEQRTLGPDHTDTLATTIGLADVLKKEKRYSESEMLFERTLDGLRRAVGANHPDTANAAYYLAEVLALQGKRDAAFTNLRFAVGHALAAENRQGIEKDPDFESLHGDPGFEALVAQAKERAVIAQTPK
jgi:eukaryotic-like serine/threonine-protein kinase